MTHSNRTFPSFALMTLFALGTASCASTLSKKDCESADFYQIGLKDGKNGKSLQQLSELNSECGAHGVAVAKDKYHYGRQVGLTEYCDADRGRDDAKDGNRSSVCLEEKVPPYLTAFNAQLVEERSEKQKELQKLREKQQENQKKRAKIEDDLDRIDNQAPTPSG